MEYVFGSTFVCKTTDAAREVNLQILVHYLFGILISFTADIDYISLLYNVLAGHSCCLYVYSF